MPLGEFKQVHYYGVMTESAHTCLNLLGVAARLLYGYVFTGFKTFQRLWVLARRVVLVDVAHQVPRSIEIITPIFKESQSSPKQTNPASFDSGLCAN